MVFTIGNNPVTYETWFKKTNTTDWQYLMLNLCTHKCGRFLDLITSPRLSHGQSRVQHPWS